jgi:hypothetical protein
MANSTTALSAQQIIEEQKIGFDQIPTNVGINFLFDSKKKFLDHLIEKSGLSPYPASLNTEAGQKIVREMQSRFVEELMEAFEVVEEIHELKGLAPSHEVVEKYRAAIYKVNEEIADTMHFFINMLIYSGFTADSFYHSVLRFMVNDGYVDGPVGRDISTLEDLLGYGRFLNVKWGIGSMGSSSQGDPFIWPMYNYNQAHYQTLVNFMFDCTYTSSRTINLLKLRYWRSDKRQTSSEEFLFRLTHSAIVYLRMLDFMGFNDKSAKKVFQVKDHINWVRVLGQ